MATFEIKRRDAKTGNKRDRVVRKLSADQLRRGSWARALSGSAYHFFIDAASVCGRARAHGADNGSMLRKLCPECYAAVNHANANAA